MQKWDQDPGTRDTILKIVKDLHLLKIVKDLHLLTIFIKDSILDVPLGFEFASE